jgi:hypothetical protein
VATTRLIEQSSESYGSFYTTVPLPEGANTEKLTAKMRDGVLEITVPLDESARPRRVQIQEKRGQLQCGVIMVSDYRYRAVGYRSKSFSYRPPPSYQSAESGSCHDQSRLHNRTVARSLGTLQL